MIPLSNGRSPRIDQFYATLRAYKSHQLHEDLRDRSDQQKSIEHIRSLGKEILESAPSLIHLKTSKAKQKFRNLNKSTQSLFRSANLYDKYKTQTGKKISGQVNRTKEVMFVEQTARTPEKVKTDRKYQQIPSKINIKSNTNKLNGLNYAKKTEIEAKKLKKEQEEVKKVQKQMKEKANYFQKTGNTTKAYREAILSGVLKRADQLQARKQKCIEKIRNQQLEKSMCEATFHPRIISRKISGMEPNFQKRSSLAETKRLSNEKQLITEAVNSHSFNPQINSYRNTNSKIGKIWKQQKMRPTAREGQPHWPLEEFTELGSKSPRQTANSTQQINLKSLNEISFIFQ